MRKEHITTLESTERGLQASRVSSHENIPMTDKRLEIIFQGITRNVIVIMSFWLAGKVLPEADIFKAGFLAFFSIIIIGICLYYSYQCKHNR